MSISIEKPELVFSGTEVLRLCNRRLEHLVACGLDVLCKERTVLEAGAGAGNMTRFFLSRKCRVMITDVREVNLQILQQIYGKQVSAKTGKLDLDNPAATPLPIKFDIVFCYDVLSLLTKPAAAIKFMAENSNELLLLETVVSGVRSETIQFTKAPKRVPDGPVHAKECRPSRYWIYNKLSEFFPYVYLPVTQPCHFDFPTDWNDSGVQSDAKRTKRAVFVASRNELKNSFLTREIPDIQPQCC